MAETRVRFAPSPTGFLHIGGLRTALYDYLFARNTGGKFILRIEDTDRSRFVPGAIENIIAVLARLGLRPDEGPELGGDYGPYIQSERLAIYQKEANRLLEAGHAYPCFCSSETLAEMRQEQQSRGEFVKYDRRCLSLSKEEVHARMDMGEKHVLRLRMPDNRRFIFEDIIRGRVEIDSSQSDDQVLIKSDGFPTYHLAAVVDDHYMRISHVIRGEEWLSSTPKHIWLNECLGWDAPHWVHLPLILNPDRSKLSKRMNDVSVESYLEKGYLPEALLNFVALLGWHGADDRELYSLDELCSQFTLERVNKAGAVFDLAKLDWMNGWYLRNLPLDDVIRKSIPYFASSSGLTLPSEQALSLIVNAARERCTLLPEIAEYGRMFLEPISLGSAERELISTPESQKVLRWFLESLSHLEEVSKDELDSLVKQGMAELGLKGKLFYTPLRIALIGKQHGPDLHTIISILTHKVTINRLQESIKTNG